MEPPIRLRLFWTWDHCTAWALNRPGGHDIGASNEYARTPEAFVADYTLVLRWCAQHGIDGVVVWGLLRDIHGGAESVHRLCEVAHECGVKLLAGVGLNAYGGVYYEGDSPWALQQHLETHPELYGRRTPDGPPMIYGFGPCGPKPTHHACPSRPENQEFAQESLRWLFETFALDGVQMEAGDTGVCECRLCADRRQHPVSVFSWEDMALMYPLAAEAIRSVRPEALIVAETYAHPQPHDGPEPPTGFGQGVPPWAAECVARFPEGIVVQWVCDQWVAPSATGRWTEAGTPPPGPQEHLMRAHFGTYWSGYRDQPRLESIAEMTQQSVRRGFMGLSLFGDSSPYHTGSELNYLALADCGSAANPEASLDSFLDRVAAPLLGGPELAREFLRLARLIERPEEIPTALPRIRQIAASLDGRAAERWTWLARFLGAFGYET